MTASADAQVTHKRIYRTLAGGASWLFDQQITNATTTATTSIADGSLGAAIELDNDLPPNAPWAFAFQEHMFLLRDPTNPHYLRYSKRFRPESFPTANFLEIGNPADPLQSGVALSGFAGVLSRLTKYRIFGNSTSGFVALEALSSRGTPAPQAITVTSRGAVFVARDGLFLTNFLEPDQELTTTIQSLFYGETINEMPPINWTQTAAMSVAEFKRRLYFGYSTGAERMLAVYSQDTGRWYFYQQHPVQTLFVDEVADQLLMGGEDGLTWVLENTAADDGSAIALTADFPERAVGNPWVKKLFGYLRLDTEGGTVNADLYIDGVFVRTYTSTGTRRRLLQRVPQVMGQTWQVRNVRYTGTEEVKIHGAEILALPLEEA